MSLSWEMLTWRGDYCRGNIIVMGHLRGVVHAGAFGCESIVAARLQPTQLRIANHITRAPDGEEIVPKQPEIARIHNGVVIIEKIMPTELRTKISLAK